MTTNLPLRHVAAAALSLGALLFAPAAHAGDFQLGLAAGGAASEWRGDAAGYSSLELGYRFADLVGIYAVGRAGYATVDERTLGTLGLGARIWGRLGRARPFLRVGVLHQHEEPLSSVRAQPVDAVFGVGDGIRHRYAVDLGLGLDVPFFTRKSLSLFGRAEATGLWFPDPRGPHVYAGGGLGIGMSYSL